VFDEMSISICISTTIGCTEGSEELERHCGTSSIANHALVFMLSALCKKWKQPVACYLILGSTKVEMLENLLMYATMQDW
jgi:hypothetical protein